MIRLDRTTNLSVVNTEHPYYPMRDCPLGKKVILLGAGGVATISEWNGKDDFWKGWAPLPVWVKGVSDA